MQSVTMLKAAYQLQSNTTATAPNRIIGAANDLIGALHIVGRPDAVNNIMRIMGSVKPAWAPPPSAVERDARME